MSEINFVGPAHQSDVVEIGVETVALGRTSITVRCEARNRDTQSTILSVEKVVFVALDAKGKPTMHKLARLEQAQRRMSWANGGLFSRLAGRTPKPSDLRRTG